MSPLRSAAPAVAGAESGYRPRINLVPEPLWEINMRALMSGTEWRQLRQALLKRQGMLCSTCRKKESPSSRLHAHEEWNYDESKEPAVARLTRVALVCWHCHACEHWGQTLKLANSKPSMAQAKDDTIAHFCRLNSATEADFRAHEVEAFSVWRRRSERKWRIDYGIFTEWAVKSFNRDLLNDRPWPAFISLAAQGEFPPAMAQIVAQMFGYPVRSVWAKATPELWQMSEWDVVP